MKHFLLESRGSQPVRNKDRDLDSNAKGRTSSFTEEESQVCCNVSSRTSGRFQKIEPNLEPRSQKQRSSPVVLSEQPTREVEAYLRDEIQDFNLNAICEDDEESHHSDVTLEQSNLASNKKINQSFQTASTVTNSSTSSAQKSKSTPTNQPLENGYINDLMRNILDVAISKAQLANDKTEIELVLERTNDTDMAHDEGNFIQKALSNLSCTKQDPVPKPSVLAKITVHVVPSKLLDPSSAPVEQSRSRENLPQAQWQKENIPPQGVGTPVTTGVLRSISKSNELTAFPPRSAPYYDGSTGVKHPLKHRSTSTNSATEVATATDDPRKLKKPQLSPPPPPPLKSEGIRPSKSHPVALAQRPPQIESYRNGKR